MHFKVVKFGKVKFNSISTQVEVYEKRLKKFSKVIFPKDDEKTQLQFLDSLDSNSLLVVFDEGGEMCTSQELSEIVRKMAEDRRIKSCYFGVGGPFGLCDALKKRAKLSIALSKMVFTSDLAWLIVWEQLYRAEKLSTDASHYHHD